MVRSPARPSDKLQHDKLQHSVRRDGRRRVPAAQPAPDAQRDRRMRRVERMARWLDASVRVPGTPWRLGADSLIGLIPGVGDAASSLLSLYLVYEARRAGISNRVLMRMLANVGVDLAIGLFPVIGDIADVAYKANLRNARLLRKHLRQSVQESNRGL